MEPSPRCDPDELARLVRAGDVAALDQMTRCFGERLLVTGRRCCGDGERARDAVQDAMLAAGEHLADYRGDGSVEGWLARMVCNACRRMRRGRKHDPALHEEAGEAIVAPGDTPHDGAARAELLGRIGAALLELAPRDRALVLLADAEGWTAPELAEHFALTAEGVRTRLSRARRRLRERLGNDLPHDLNDG